MKSNAPSPDAESHLSSRPRLILRDRQRVRPVDRRLLRWIIKALLQDLLHRETYDLGVYLVAAPEMTRVNEGYLQHAGSTDVITFDYTDPAQPELLAGELFVCVDEALIQARRFRTTWQSEVVRYIVHGVLHLSGYDDLEPTARRRMKKAENRLLQALARQFYLPKLAGAGREKDPRNPKLATPRKSQIPNLG